jgi:hypothetical protein
MKSVVICGSSKFAEEARIFAKKLKDLGVLVFEPHFYRVSGGDWSRIHRFDVKFVARGLTHDHFYKIRMADVVFVYNVDGYIGVSTNMEIGYAAALGKPIYALSGKDPEVCRQVLFSGIASTPAELSDKFLK